MQILQVKTVEDFNNSQVPAGKLLVWLEVTDGKATFHCKDENGNVQKISSTANKNCVLLSPDAVASGLDNISGGYAARISAYDAVTKKITLIATDDYPLEPEKYINDADIYIALNMSDLNGVQKHSIASSTVLYDTTDPSLVLSIDIILVNALEAIISGGDAPVFDDESVWIAVVEWADSDVTTQAEGQGNFASGESASANGSYNMIIGLCSHGNGVMNKLVGDISKVHGNNNLVTGNTLSVDGTGNKVNGTFSRVRGSSNTTDGDMLLVSGSLNEIIGDSITVNGFNNKTVIRTRLVVEGTTIEEKPRQVYISGTMNEVNADYTHTCGYRLTNRAKHATMFGRDTYLDDSPENEGAFILGGGELNNPRNALEVRCRRKILNPLYNPVNDPDGNGVDSDGEKQYIAEMAFAGQYKGRLTGTTQTVIDAAGSVVMNHDYYNRWKITPSAAVTPVLKNWQDDDNGKLIIYNGGTYFQFPVAWNWIGSQPSLTSSGYDVFSIEQIDNDIFIKHEVTK